MPGTNLTATQAGGSQVNRNVLSGINVKTAKVNVGDSEHEELIREDSVDIIVGVFFDGTLNNRTNTEARLEYEKKQKGESYNKKKANVYNNDKWYTFQKDGSYDNDFSNVSRMEPAYKNISEEKIKQISIYVEGIGTEDLKDDGTWGKASGKGETGVKGKVKKACEKIAEKINKLSVKKINRLQIDAYGFSRGAAAARNFVFEINQNKGDVKETLSAGLYSPSSEKYKEDGGVLGEKLEENSISLRFKTQARFIGLYDTVASFGFKHTNDTAQLHLTAISKALYTFQIAAGDEHRDNFRLTNINSASRGTQKFLPGVHSDIGGGYTDNASEDVRLDYSGYLPNLEAERTVLINKGWYTNDEIYVNTFLGTLVGKRTKISNKYTLIPMHIMVEFSIKQKVKFEMNKIKSKLPIKDEPNKGVKLTEVKTRIDEYVNGQKGRLGFDNEKDKKMLKSLRNKYFHFSSHYSSIGMAPNRENGVRVRVVQNG